MDFVKNTIIVWLFTPLFIYSSSLLAGNITVVNHDVFLSGDNLSIRFEWRSDYEVKEVKGILAGFDLSESLIANNYQDIKGYRGSFIKSFKVETVSPENAKYSFRLRDVSDKLGKAIEGGVIVDKHKKSFIPDPEVDPNISEKLNMTRDNLLKIDLPPVMKDLKVLHDKNGQVFFEASAVGALGKISGIGFKVYDTQGIEVVNDTIEVDEQEQAQIQYKLTSLSVGSYEVNAVAISSSGKQSNSKSKRFDIMPDASVSDEVAINTTATEPSNIYTQSGEEEKIIEQHEVDIEQEPEQEPEQDIEFPKITMESSIQGINAGKPYTIYLNLSDNRSLKELVVNLNGNTRLIEATKPLFKKGNRYQIPLSDLKNVKLGLTFVTDYAHKRALNFFVQDTSNHKTRKTIKIEAHATVKPELFNPKFRYKYDKKDGCLILRERQTFGGFTLNYADPQGAVSRVYIRSTFDMPQSHRTVVAGGNPMVSWDKNRKVAWGDTLHRPTKNHTLEIFKSRSFSLSGKHSIEIALKSPYFPEVTKKICIVGGKTNDALDPPKPPVRRVPDPRDDDIDHIRPPKREPLPVPPPEEEPDAIGAFLKGLLED